MHIEVEGLLGKHPPNGCFSSLSSRALCCDGLPQEEGEIGGGLEDGLGGG